VERRKKPRRKSRIPIFAVVAVVIVFFCILTYSFLQHTNQTNINQGFSYKAAIVDHLSLSQPNQTFVENVTTVLEQAGFTVDYYPGEKVTVEFYRNLPSYGYGLIVFRVHTTQRGAFFTSEPYSISQYVMEQLNDQVWRVSYNEGKPPLYFGIPSSFVTLCMDGKFSETVVIAMGCDTLRFSDMAKAFIEKGAKVYVGWNGPVSTRHTDHATVQFLEHLIVEKQTINKAVTETMAEVGPDPMCESVLLYYPIEAKNFIIPKSPSTLITNVVEINVKYFERDKNVIGFLCARGDFLSQN
jgi:hypothetical protein